MRTLVIGLTAHTKSRRTSSSYLNLITSTKTLLPDKVIFAGSVSLDLDISLLGDTSQLTTLGVRIEEVELNMEKSRNYGKTVIFFLRSKLRSRRSTGSRQRELLG